MFKVDYGHEEVKIRFGSDPRHYRILTQEFLDDGHGNVCGIKTVQVEWVKDELGRWQMKPEPNTEKIYKADLVLLAMGFLGPEREAIDELGLNLDPRSNIDTTNYYTSVNNIFAAGDCRRGQSLVVWAISEGRQAARSVDSFLMHCDSRLPGLGGIIQPRKVITNV